MSFKYCEHCTAGNVLPGQPTGQMLDGAYFVPGSSAESDPSAAKSKAIILLTDIFGLPLVNSKIVADQLAQSTGFDVWVPDQFDGWPVVEVSELDDKLPQRPGEKIPLFKKLSVFFLLLLRAPRLWNSRPAAVDKRVHSFISKVKQEKGYTSIGVVGYCFGGGTVIRLASTDYINSAVVAHPGAFSAKDIEKMKVPSLFLCAEGDEYFSPKQRNEAEAIFAARKDKPDFVEYQFNNYKGTVHGFAIRPNLAIPEAKEGFEKAFESTVQWFKKTLN